MIQAAGKNIQYVQTKAYFPEVLQPASRRGQEVGKSGTYTITPVLQNLLIKTHAAQALNMSVPEPLSAVGQKTDIIKVTVPELLVANCRHIQEASSTPNISGALRGAGKYIQENPGTFALQAIGASVTVGALLTIPILNIAGFALTGPVAKSAAAVWQSLLGLVPASSAFAWCQSATMGGAAVSDIIAVGAAGAGVAGAATASQVPGVRGRLRALFGKDVNRPRL
jgi:hypothetical protein